MTTAWKESTQKIFWGVIVIAVAGIFSSVYDFVSIFVMIADYAAQMLPALSGPTSSVTTIKVLGGLGKAAVVAGYVFYLLGLTQFSTMQSDQATGMNILKVRSAVYILIGCFAANVLFGILLSIPGIGIVLSIAIWVATLMAYFKMRNAFAGLTASPAFSPVSQRGAGQLRLAAQCNIWQMLLPIAVGVIMLLIGLAAMGMMSSRNGLEGLQGMAILAGVVLFAAVVCNLVLMFFSLVYPFLGWYKIMNGGPAQEGHVYDETANVGQQVAGMPASPMSDQMKNLSESGKKAVASAQQAIGQAWQNMRPTVEHAGSWAVANKVKLAIGAGALAVIALLIWLVPKLFGGGPVEFETYEVQADTVSVSGAPAAISVFVDIPKGSGKKQENLVRAIREMMAQSQLAGEVGAPKVAPLKEVVDDYVSRYLEYMASEEYGPIQCDLGVVGGYQNEASVTIHFVDGFYGNGGPQEYDYVVRLSDGHVMEQSEMVNISGDQLSELIVRYGGEDVPVYLDEGYWLSPAGADSCKVLWPIGSHFTGEAMIPLSELEPYLTDEGKALMQAKPVGDVRESGGQDAAEDEGTPENEPIVIEEPGRGDLGIFDLRGPVKECRTKRFGQTSTVSFDEDGKWTKENGKSLSSKYSGGVRRDSNGRLTKGMFDPYDETGHDYTLNEQGLVTGINYRDYMDAGSTVSYTYDDDGYVKAETWEEWGMDASEEATVYEYTILEKDEHGNWTKRQSSSGDVETREITYYP